MPGLESVKEQITLQLNFCGKSLFLQLHPARSFLYPYHLLSCEKLPPCILCGCLLPIDDILEKPNFHIQVSFLSFFLFLLKIDQMTISMVKILLTLVVVLISCPKSSDHTTSYLYCIEKVEGPQRNPGEKRKRQMLSTS